MPFLPPYSTLYALQEAITPKSKSLLKELAVSNYAPTHSLQNLSPSPSPHVTSPAKASHPRKISSATLPAPTSNSLASQSIPRYRSPVQKSLPETRQLPTQNSHSLPATCSRTTDSFKWTLETC